MAQEEFIEEDAEKGITEEALKFAKKISSPYEDLGQAPLVEAGVLTGIVWQAERSYSEKEAGELVYNIIGQYGKHYGIMIDGAKLNELFEQFKKKA